MGIFLDLKKHFLQYIHTCKYNTNFLEYKIPQKVKLLNENSDFLIAKGTVLEPLLFKMYVNDILEVSTFMEKLSQMLMI